ncbi:hypothetical protein PPERSA_04129 [Pseudocohnilembus persalinus]|uniref:Uncharacterized protein n=1 Tax=Pseudocohnilembus persalinus TaxID=266149 RepID=A0A0V0QMI4_PSEPJ|nr:hypothetical protein PPERSA_04129 [Pseudocohnilembus persalinus]|eukprot:KRX03577.1 hypothetical protein PPERSA_04129 [Pseudocohnilembus persalinus]
MSAQSKAQNRKGTKVDYLYQEIAQLKEHVETLEYQLQLNRAQLKIALQPNLDNQTSQDNYSGPQVKNNNTKNINDINSVKSLQLMIESTRKENDFLQNRVKQVLEERDQAQGKNLIMEQMYENAEKQRKETIEDLKNNTMRLQNKLKEAELRLQQLEKNHLEIDQLSGIVLQYRDQNQNDIQQQNEFQQCNESPQQLQENQQQENFQQNSLQYNENQQNQNQQYTEQNLQNNQEQQLNNNQISSLNQHNQIDEDNDSFDSDDFDYPYLEDKVQGKQKPVNFDLIKQRQDQLQREQQDQNIQSQTEQQKINLNIGLQPNNQQFQIPQYQNQNQEEYQQEYQNDQDNYEQQQQFQQNINININEQNNDFNEIQQSQNQDLNEEQYQQQEQQSDKASDEDYDEERLPDKVHYIHTQQGEEQKGGRLQKLIPQLDLSKPMMIAQKTVDKQMKQEASKYIQQNGFNLQPYIDKINRQLNLNYLFLSFANIYQQRKNRQDQRLERAGKNIAKELLKNKNLEAENERLQKENKELESKNETIIKAYQQNEEKWQKQQKQYLILDEFYRKYNGSVQLNSGERSNKFSQIDESYNQNFNFSDKASTTAERTFNKAFLQNNNY